MTTHVTVGHGKLDELWISYHQQSGWAEWYEGGGEDAIPEDLLAALVSDERSGYFGMSPEAAEAELESALEHVSLGREGRRGLAAQIATMTAPTLTSVNALAERMRAEGLQVSSVVHYTIR